MRPRRIAHGALFALAVAVGRPASADPPKKKNP